jgi:hypothetical protein
LFDGHWIGFPLLIALSALPFILSAGVAAYVAARRQTILGMVVAPVGCVLYWLGHWAYLRLTLPAAEELMRRVEAGGAEQFFAMQRTFGGEAAAVSAPSLVDFLPVAGVDLVYALPGAGLGVLVAWIARHPARAMIVLKRMCAYLRPRGPAG